MSQSYSEMRSKNVREPNKRPKQLTDESRRRRQVLTLLLAVAWDTVKTRKRYKDRTNVTKNRLSGTGKTHSNRREKATTSNKILKNRSSYQSHKRNFRTTTESNHGSQRGKQHRARKEKARQRRGKQRNRLIKSTNTGSKQSAHSIPQTTTSPSKMTTNNINIKFNAQTRTFKEVRKEPKVKEEFKVGSSLTERGKATIKLYQTDANGNEWAYHFADHYWLVIWAQIFHYYFHIMSILVNDATQRQDWTKAQRVYEWARMLRTTAEALGHHYVPQDTKDLYQSFQRYVEECRQRNNTQLQIPDVSWEQTAAQQRKGPNTKAWRTFLFYRFFYTRTRSIKIEVAGATKGNMLERFHDQHSLLEIPLYNMRMWLAEGSLPVGAFDFPQEGDGELRGIPGYPSQGEQVIAAMKPFKDIEPCPLTMDEARVMIDQNNPREEEEDEYMEYDY